MVENGRYQVFGVIPSEHERGNPELDPDAQRLGGSTLLYATDDPKEAKKIVDEGGFLRDNVWCAATWARDIETGGTIGNAPG